MRRLLPVFLALLIVTVATTAPSVACVGTTSSAGVHHDCCEGQAISAPPVSSCCVVSAPIGERSFVESRLLAGSDHATHAHATLISAWLQAPDNRVDRPGGSPSLLRVHTTPLYLQQLSLLI